MSASTAPVQDLGPAWVHVGAHGSAWVHERVRVSVRVRVCLNPGFRHARVRISQVFLIYLNGFAQVCAGIGAITDEVKNRNASFHRSVARRKEERVQSIAFLEFLCQVHFQSLRGAFFYAGPLREN